ncbi:hypothetical protein AKUH4B114J_11290 [Apilactobacillus kunkeei]|uniref:hypothetical protein n=1 Tax=Apilactobacillus kunkeei TaxID=148814 RepID=UPI000695BBB2|nr:hypothetical protein [Apilactobacillus kunkeei]MBX8455929.1 hypothetical protein [Apilactobacillus kunkeei]QYU54112.1 hypothetical protein K2W87_05590 [Apilactobacillus kunkeei]CAI2629912.1 hypothetical protein AKUH3B202M_11300 [Apilactobacillus kunkeei]CAI2632528.1 hypothetical protein AKUH2B105J_11280 [Apilactobacillus kunkeei]CAI2633309.1 hypothetical protein AKUH3B101X_11290 [Apilactobacillus kunkeei]
MKKLLLSVLLATVMFGGAAVEVTASANAKTEHTTKHHANKKAVKKHAVKKHAKKATKKHAKKVVKKHVAKKTTKKKARKVAKKHVAKKVVKKSVKKVASKVANNTTSSNGGYGEIKQDRSSWLYNKGDGSYASVKAHAHELAKHDKGVRDELKKYGDSYAALMTKEVSF